MPLKVVGRREYEGSKIRDIELDFIVIFLSCSSILVINGMNNITIVQKQYKVLKSHLESRYLALPAILDEIIPFEAIR